MRSEITAVIFFIGIITLLASAPYQTLWLFITGAFICIVSASIETYCQIKYNAKCTKSEEVNKND